MIKQFYTLYMKPWNKPNYIKPVEETIEEDITVTVEKVEPEVEPTVEKVEYIAVEKVEYICPICNKSFSTKRGLKQHMTMTHPEE